MRVILFIILTFVFFIVAHPLGVYPHEYMHSIMAWALGLKEHPFNIHIAPGINGWLLAQGIDENNNYVLMSLLGHRQAITVIALAGPGMNVLLFVLTSWLIMKCKSLRNHPWVLYFLFMFALINLGNIFDYIPFRVFGTHGDIGNALLGLGNPSPWWVFIPGTYFVVCCLYFFYKHMLPLVYKYCCADNLVNQVFLLVAVTYVLFYLCASVGLVNYGPVSRFISLTSFTMIPGIIFITWPQRGWVRKTLNNIK